MANATVPVLVEPASGQATLARLVPDELALVVAVDPPAAAVVAVLDESLLPPPHAASNNAELAAMANHVNERRFNVIFSP